MAVLVRAVNVIVVVLPVLRASVVRRVNVDAVHLARIAEEQALERVVVLSVDDNLVGLVAAVLDPTGLA